MGYDTQDQEVIKLLTQLKKTGAEYPQDLLVVRRQRYLVRMAQIGLGVGTNMGNKNQRASGPLPAAGTLLETILLVAIVAEASAVGYFYRDKVTDFLQKITSPAVVEEVSTLPVPTVFETQAMTPSPFLTATVTSPTLAQSISGTPAPGFIENDNAAATQANSTPDLNGNNGNHYGQTPKPERTRENNNRPPQDNNNSHPNDNRDEPKPTKSK
jgi:hypothetical protein